MMGACSLDLSDMSQDRGHWWDAANIDHGALDETTVSKS
jgi:hypothetical protein